MNGSDDIATRLRRLEDIEAIRRLVGLYALAMDDRDTGLVASIFAKDGVFRWHDGFVHAQGREAIVAMFGGRFARPSFHVTHDHLIDLDADDPDRATGIVFGHAEAQRDDGQYVAATRYRDTYMRRDGRWQIRERVLQHLYFVTVDEYAGILRRPDRIKTPAGRRAGHWPEE
jgi:uncharacterized protein (TIGR02246 family)